VASTQLETLQRSLSLPGMRRFKNVTFALLFVISAIVIIAIATTQEESLLTVGVSVLSSTTIICGGGLALRWGSIRFARRHAERVLAAIPDGPSLLDYFELLGREATTRAIELEIEVGDAQRGRHREIEHAIHLRFPGVKTIWHADTATVRSPAYTCQRELDLDDEADVIVHDNGPLHAFFVGVLACTGPAKRVRIREVKR
jgi:hypothetical protein